MILRSPAYNRHGRSYQVPAHLRSENWLCQLHTDAEFLRGNDGFSTDAQRKRAWALARAAGINPTGKHYSPQLADTRGPADPGAWYDSREQVRAVCLERGLGCHGAVNVPTPEVAIEKRSYRVADDLVEGKVSALEEEHGAFGPEERPRIFEDVRQAMSPEGGEP